MQAHHYLGALPKIGETLWYVVTWHDQWVALLSFSAAAWKCAVRDRWIGWDFRHQYDRLHLLANNSRFLILPDWHRPNLASRTLSLCQKRLPERLVGDLRASAGAAGDLCGPATVCGNDLQSGELVVCGPHQGVSPNPAGGYSPTAQSPKLVFVKCPCRRNARALLSRPTLEAPYRQRSTQDHAERRTDAYALPDFFRATCRTRAVAQGRRHPLPTVLAIAAGATLVWDARLQGHRRTGPEASAPRRESVSAVVAKQGRRSGSESNTSFAMCSCASIRWRSTGPCSAGMKSMAKQDESLAIDGKTMCNAIDEEGHQTTS